MSVGNIKTGSAIRSAIVPMAESGAALRRAYEDGTTRSLVDLLRSDAELLPADRDLLADLLAGQLGRQVGRQDLKAGMKIKRTEAMVAYREGMAVRPRPRKEVMLEKIADRFGFTFAQMQDIVRKAKRPV